MSLLYLVLAILGLGFLIFIHELGHYWMARRVGMRVESFGIGFGRPIYSFMRNGVKWSICWLPFGGYVKIAGMEKEENKEPNQIPDGFFGKSPWARIKVSIMGPLANIVCALLFFTILWAFGGRERSFSETTKKVGWVDPKSELYKAGIRPGDEIISYDGELINSSKAHFQAAMLAGETLKVTGRHWDDNEQKFTPFSLKIHPYPHPLSQEPGILTTGVLSPASYIVYAPQQPSSDVNNIGGIKAGDRIIWASGERIYSLPQLSALLNDNHVLLTIERGNTKFLRRVPTVAIEDLKLTNEVREELVDWQWEADLKKEKFQKLRYIPYNIDLDGVVEGRLSFIDQEKTAQIFPSLNYSEKSNPLEKGDRITAVEGKVLTSPYQLLKAIQKRQFRVIVQHDGFLNRANTWKEADDTFNREFSSDDLLSIEKSIGTDKELTNLGTLVLLDPITPKTRAEIAKSQGIGPEFEKEMEEERKQIQAIEDPQLRDQALKSVDKREKQLLLGVPAIQDVKVSYNPNPFTLFKNICDEVIATFTALVGGYLNPKWISGPIGIVQAIHSQWMVGFKEALFWLGAISLNLGLFNLFPLPVLDGGYICMSLFELLTGTKLNAKMVEKIIVPFAVLLIAFLVFLTYNDISRIVGHLFR